jgi:hypothetical protein
MLALEERGPDDSTFMDRHHYLRIEMEGSNARSHGEANGILAREQRDIALGGLYL